MLVAFSKTRKEPNPTCVKFDSQALEPIWLPTAASYLRTVSEHSVNFLTKRGEKNGKGKERKTKGGAAQSPDQAKGRQGQDKEPQGAGERKNTFRLGQARAQVLDKCSRTALLA